MATSSLPDRVPVAVIGGGQAGLAVGHALAERGVPFVILDAHARIGDAWRQRWDSLRLFTPARFDGLAGLPFPAPSFSFPTKDEMADYLERYARHFRLPVHSGVRVQRLSREGTRYVLDAGGQRIEADHVVVAMSSFQTPKVPRFAADLDPRIVQLHSSEYRRPDQLQPGPVLLAGAGNSGADIALELARTHRTYLAGRDTGHVPFRIEGRLARVLLPLLFRVVFHRVLTVATPIGRLVRRKLGTSGGALIRVKPQDLAAAGVERTPRVSGVRHGRPVLDDGRVLDVANVVWSTGYGPGFSWIDLPGRDAEGALPHDRGIATTEPGLYFVGLIFLYAFSSTMIQGVSRDAERVAAAIAGRLRESGAPVGAVPAGSAA